MFISSIDTGLTPMPALLPDQGKERETRSTYLDGTELYPRRHQLPVWRCWLRAACGYHTLSIPVAFIGWIIPTIVSKFKILAAAASIWLDLPSFLIHLYYMNSTYKNQPIRQKRLLRIASKPNQLRTYERIVRPLQLKVKAI